MNYLKIYNQLCSTRKELMDSRQYLKNSGEYFEKHHIKLKCLGGTDNIDNIVLLTAREHFIAHFLIYKLAISIPLIKDKTKRNLIFSFICMKGRSCLHKNQRYFNSRLYEHSKIEFSKSQYGRKLSDETKHKISKANSGRTHTKEHKLKNALAQKGRTHSSDTKRKISEANKGKGIGVKLSENTRYKMSINNGRYWLNKSLSPAHKKKLSISQTGRITSDTTRQKLSIAGKSRKKLKCPYCGRELDPGNAKLYHFDNCKSK